MPLLKGVSRDEENARGDMRFHINDRAGCGLARVPGRATLELEGTPPKVEAVRIRFYQVK